MYCNKCGTNIPDDSAFCPVCGTSFADLTTQNPIQDAPQSVQSIPVIVASQTQNVSRSNGMGTAGLILGIVGMFFSWIPYVGWIIPLLGLIFSIIGLAKRNVVKGAAIAGLILSILSVFFSMVMGLGVNAYLNKARAAASSIDAYNSSVSEVDNRIDKAL